MATGIPQCEASPAAGEKEVRQVRDGWCSLGESSRTGTRERRSHRSMPVQALAHTHIHTYTSLGQSQFFFIPIKAILLYLKCKYIHVSCKYS